MAKTDELSQLIGNFGLWQFSIFFLMFCARISSAWVHLAILFLTPALNFRCVEFATNTTVAVENSTCYEQCLRYDYYTTPYDATVVSEWELICDRKWLASFTQTVLQFGVLVGSILFGFLSDRFGRKGTFLVAVIIQILTSFLIPFSMNYTMFTTLRFFVGMAGAGTTIISFVIVVESIGAKYRDVAGCIFQLAFVLGHLTIPIFAYYYRSWTTYSLALAIPQLCYLGYFFALTESPRWLISVGKSKEATKILKRAAKQNKLSTLYIKDTVKKLAEKSLLKDVQPHLNYLDLFREPFKMRIWSSLVIWLVAGLVYYGTNQYVSQTKSDPFVSVAVAAAMEIPSNLATVVLIRYYGRKKTTATFFLLGGICFVVLGNVSEISWVTLTLGTAAVSCASITATSVYIYTSELFPTVIRNMTIGVCSMFLRLGSMVAPFVVNWSSTTPWITIIAFGFAPILAGLVCLLLPETKGTVLPDKINDLRDYSDLS